MSMTEFREMWERLDSSRILLGGMLAIGILVGLLYQVGLLGLLLRSVSLIVVAGVRGGFHVWRQALAWMPWPMLLAAVVVVSAVAAFVGSIVEITGGLLLLSAGVFSCLAYVYLESERDAVERGYKSLHNPMKGQQLAADLATYGPRAGTPLLIVATLATIFGFALLNDGLYQSGAEHWYRLTAAPRIKPDTDLTEPLKRAGFLDFLAYTVINFIRVVDLLDVANAYNQTHIAYVQQAKWPASTLLMLFRSFFTMVLLQQVMAALRRGNLMWQSIADFWSPHGPIHDRAAMALQAQGIVAVRPLMRSVRNIAYLTPEQRDELPRLIAEIGPRAEPALMRYLRDRDENTRLVAVSALGRLQALDALWRLSRLADDPSDAVRQGLADTFVVITEPGPQHLAKQWRLRHPDVAKRTWLVRLRELVPWWRPAPPNAAIIGAARQMLRDNSPAVRVRAAQALANLGRTAASAEPDLLALLNDPDESVRCKAATSLGRIGDDDARVAETLSRLLADDSPTVRMAAAQALGERGESMSSVAAALLPLLRDTEPDVRTAATKAIASIGILTEEARRELAAGLTSQDTVVRAQTAEVMGTIKVASPETIPSLIAALNDASDQVRVNAAEAIGNAGPDASVAVPALIAALRDPDHRVCALAARALAAIGPKAAPAAAALTATLRHVNTVVRIQAAEALGRIGERSAGSIAALRGATADPDGAVRAAAIVALTGAEEAHQELRTALADPDPRVRCAAIDALTPRATEADIATALVNATGDSSDVVKERVALALGGAGIATPDAIESLCRLLADDTPAVQIAAAQALGKLGPAAIPAVEILAHVLRTGDVGLRRQVLHSLAMIDAPALLPVAATALNDDDPEVRKFTSAALLKVPTLTEDVIKALIDALRDPEVQVRSNAATALGRLDPLPDEAAAALADNLANTDDGLRLAVVRALTRAASAQVLQYLPRMLSDTNYNVRLTVARALLTIDVDHAAARSALASDLAADSDHIREAAQLIMTELQIDEPVPAANP